MKLQFIILFTTVLSVSSFAKKGTLECWKEYNYKNGKKTSFKPLCSCDKKLKFSILNGSEPSVEELRSSCGEFFSVKVIDEDLPKNRVRVSTHRGMHINSNISTWMRSAISSQNLDLLKYILNSQKYDLSYLIFAKNMIRMKKKKEFEQKFLNIKFPESSLMPLREIVPTQYWKHLKPEILEKQKNKLKLELDDVRKLGVRLNSPIRLSFSEAFPKEFLDSDQFRNFADEKGNTLLHEAMLRIKDPVILEFFIEELKEDGLEINIKNELGETALHHAAIHGRHDLLDTLLKLGANIDAKDKKGFSPLDVAQQYGSYGTYRKLKSLGAKIGNENHEKFVPKGLHLFNF